MAYNPLSSDLLKKEIASESEAFELAYRWLEEHMPPHFHEEIDTKTRSLIARNLLSFKLQNKWVEIQINHVAFILCMDAPDADLKILKQFTDRAIRYYRTFISNNPPPGEKKGHLRIAIIHVSDIEHPPLSLEQKQHLYTLAKEFKENLSENEFETMLQGLNTGFLRSMTSERLHIALEMFFRAKERDQCQYEVRRNEDWMAKKAPSLQLIFAWKNVPKAGFLYRLAKIIHTHGLALRRASCTYVNPYQTDNILILSLGLHGLEGKSAWEEADIDDLLREICLLKYFEADDLVATTFVHRRLLTGNEGHLVRNFISFVHQTLVYTDPNVYSFESIIEGLCRHPELTIALCKAFESKFHPEKYNITTYQEKENEILQLIDGLDTGHAINDTRRKNILRQTLYFIKYTLKTNFYRHNKSAFSFRLDPQYLDFVPYDRKEKFPELPFGIFFIRGMHFLGFNIRFKNLARGGVRTVTPEKWEQHFLERNNIFSEAYNLAYTQQKKNKDIPEGGAKTAILLKPFEVFAKELEIYKTELEEANTHPNQIEHLCKTFLEEHKKDFLFSSQRSFIESFMTIINCDEDGILRAKSVVDYYQKPEYIYLGPDENMLNEMITWIADYSSKCHYKPGRSFMSSKPGAGINHKEFGVTSFGLNVYLHQTLLFLGIDPTKKPFTIKISGGPDGDVAGNEILNLYKYYPKTAKLLALTDVSGTIYDPEGLDLEEMKRLFEQSLPIRNYKADLLSEEGFLLDLRTKKDSLSYTQQTLLLRKKNGKIQEEWLSGNEMNHLYRSNLHQVKVNVFIPGGGRPRTLNETNIQSYLDETGRPTSQAIVEGANLYLTPEARRFLENLGTLDLKDSSCNKGGVICSSFEVLAGLCLSEEEFVKEKPKYIQEVLEIIAKAALNEANLMLDTHKKRGLYLTDISDKISEKINLYKYQLLDYFETIDLPKSPKDPLIQALLLYCPPLLRNGYQDRILAIPEIHKKAIIACYLASHIVYTRGIDWSPNIADLLPTLTKDPLLMI
jgi:glutamate dehydrogenase